MQKSGTERGKPGQGTIEKGPGREACSALPAGDLTSQYVCSFFTSADGL